MPPPASIGDWPATAIDYLDKHAGAFTAMLTVVLIGVTVWYTILNRRMVTEMGKTRALSILPKLAVEFEHIGPAVMDVAIKNVGPGPALAVDVELIFDPADQKAQLTIRRYRQNVLAPGEQQAFAPPGALDGNLDTLPRTYRAIRLTGSMKDASGQGHVVNETYDNLAEWRDLLHNANRLWSPPEPERRLADALSKKFEPPLRNLTAQVQGVASAVHRLVPPEPPDNHRD
jgi:hypothetical protein